MRCASPHEAASAFDLLGGPVVVKLDGPAHKQAAGGVALGISSAAEARAAAERMGGRVLVARQVRGRRRGVLRPHARSRLRAGAGRRASAGGRSRRSGSPRWRWRRWTHAAARELVAEAPGLAQLASPAAVDALAVALAALSRLALDRPEVEEVDINPLILGDDGATAVDALVVVKGAP